MRRRLFFRSLFTFSLVTLLLLSSPWLTVAAPLPPLARQFVPVQPAVDARDSSIVQSNSTTATSVFYPSGDAAVQEGAPNAPDPSNFYLGAGHYQGFPYGANGRVRSYMRFDLSSLPAGTSIVSATLRLYHAGGADYIGQTRNVTFYRVTGNWSEASVTWNNRPGYAETLGGVTTTYDFVGWLNLDLSNQVRAWAEGNQPNYGVVAIGPEDTPGIYRVFTSRETDHSPELHVRYLPPVPPVLDVQPGLLSVRASGTQSPPVPSLHISNVTRGSLEWTASKTGDASWLVLGKSSGSAMPTTPDNMSLTVNAAGLAPGTYTEQVRISSNTPNVAGSPLTVTFTLEVADYLSNIYLPLVTGGGGISPPKTVALIVGIGDYQYLDPAPVSSGNLPDGWGFDLPNPPKDVEAFHRLILAKFGTPPNNVLRYGGGSEETPTTAFGEASMLAYPLATRANVIAAFGQLDTMEDEDTTVIFYFSGHGGQTPDEHGDEADGHDEFIAMYDTITTTVGFTNVLTDDDLEGLLGNLESEHIVVILDSCFSGSMMDTTLQASNDLLQRGLVHPIKPRPVANSVHSDQAALAELAGPGRVIITAGTGDQGTWESNMLGHGVFTYFFLQGLQDSLHDANQNGRVSAEEAYWFIRDLVDDWVVANVTPTPENPDPHQNPDMDDQYLGQMDLAWLP